MKDLVVDLETMGTGPRAAIVAIGAYAVDLDPASSNFGMIEGYPYYAVVDLRSSMAHGLEVDASTIHWWLNQARYNPRAVEGLTDDEPVGLRPALRSLQGFYNDRAGRRVWGWPSSFDCTILASAFAATGVDSPWNHRQEQCARTVVAVAEALGVDCARFEPTVAHHALSDAYAQARTLVKAIAGLKELR